METGFFCGYDITLQNVVVSQIEVNKRAAQKASVKGSKTRSLASCVVHDLAAVCSSSTIIGLHM